MNHRVWYLPYTYSIKMRRVLKYRSYRYKFLLVSNKKQFMYFLQKNYTLLVVVMCSSGHNNFQSQLNTKKHYLHLRIPSCVKFSCVVTTKHKKDFFGFENTKFSLFVLLSRIFVCYSFQNTPVSVEKFCKRTNRLTLAIWFCICFLIQNIYACAYVSRIFIIIYIYKCI